MVAGRQVNARRAAYALGIAAAAYVLCHLYARAPMMGDDIDYYGFALDRLVRRSEFPPDSGFHFLRWTVWGPMQGFMALFGPGMAAYAFVPFASLAACCAMAYLVGARLMGERAGVLAAVFLFFHPLMNDLASRPMPDIIEALLATVGLTVLLGAMATPDDAPRRGWRLCGYGVLIGLLAFLSWVNRPTGLIWLIAAFLIALARWRIIPRVFGVALLVAAIGVACEAAIYHGMFGDYMHRWNANLGAMGRKGTEAVPFWWLPFRYLDAVASGGLLKTLLFAAGIFGGAVLWRAKGVGNRVVVAWGVLLYLGVSCGVQSVFPLRPLVREGERFIGNLAVPMSLCAAAGALAAAAWLVRRRPALGRVPVPLTYGALGLLLLLGCGRPLRDMAYLPAVRGWLDGGGRAVAANEDAYHVGWVAAPKRSRAIDWKIVRRGDVLKNPELLSPDAVGAAKTLLLNRPRFMVTLRKRLESGRGVDHDALPGDLFGPETPWHLTGVAFQPYVLDKEADMLGSPHGGQAAEFLRFELAPGDVPVAWSPVLEAARTWAWSCDTDAGALESGEGGALRFTRRGGGQARLLSPRIPVPAAWRGAPVQTRVLARAPIAEPFEVMVAFAREDGVSLATQVLRQYASQEGFFDFGGFEIPVDAATAQVLVAVKSKCARFEILDVRLSVPSRAVAP